MNRRTNNPSNARWLIPGWLGVVVLVPVLLGAGGEEPDERRARIERMMQSDRDQLRHNYEKFKQLPEEERNQLRDLHRQVEDDPQLKKTLAAYCARFRSLTPGQKEQIRNERNLVERHKLVQDIKDKQKQKAEERQRRWRGYSGRDLGQFTGRFPGMVDVQRDDFLAIMRIIEQDAALSDAQHEAFAKMTEFDRYLATLEASVKKNQSDDGQPARWPNQSLQSRIAEAVSAPDLRRMFGEQGPNDPPGHRMLWVIVSRELYQLWRRGADTFDPSDEAVQEHFLTLDVATRDELMKQSPEVFRRMSRAKYLSTRVGDLRKLFELGRSVGFMRPGGGGFGPGGDRRGPPGRSDEPREKRGGPGRRGGPETRSERRHGDPPPPPGKRD